jgi:hypothetical protein
MQPQPPLNGCSNRDRQDPMNRPSEILSTHCYTNPDDVNGACWVSFLERFAKTEQQVSFHPSAGCLRVCVFIDVRIGVQKR